MAQLYSCLGTFAASVADCNGAHPVARKPLLRRLSPQLMHGKQIWLRLLIPSERLRLLRYTVHVEAIEGCAHGSCSVTRCARIYLLRLSLLAATAAEPERARYLIQHVGLLFQFL